MEYSAQGNYVGYTRNAHEDHHLCKVSIGVEQRMRMATNWLGSPHDKGNFALQHAKPGTQYCRATQLSRIKYCVISQSPR